MSKSTHLSMYPSFRNSVADHATATITASTASAAQSTAAAVTSTTTTTTTTAAITTNPAAATHNRHWPAPTPPPPAPPHLRQQQEEERFFRNHDSNKLEWRLGPSVHCNAYLGPNIMIKKEGSFTIPLWIRTFGYEHHLEVHAIWLLPITGIRTQLVISPNRCAGGSPT